MSFPDPSTHHNKPNHSIDQFYQQFGIKQYLSFAGGFRYIDKPKIQVKSETKQPIKDLYTEFGLSKTNLQSYKIDRDYVPNTKFELADKLVEKLEHKMHKMNYYRNKYYNQSQ